MLFARSSVCVLTVLSGSPIFPLSMLVMVGDCFSNKSRPIFGACQPFFLCVTKNGFHLRAHVMPFAVQAYFRDIANGRYLLDEQLVLGFGLGVRPLGTQAVADVPGYGDDPA